MTKFLTGNILHMKLQIFINFASIIVQGQYIYISHTESHHQESIINC